MLCWVILAVCCLLDPNDPNQVRSESNAILAMIKQLPVQKQAVETKEYSGTFDTIIRQRVADTNELVEFSKEIDRRAVELCEAVGVSPANKSSIAAALEKYNNRVNAEKNLLLETLVLIVNDDLSDPNTLPAETDPNYLIEIERRNELMRAVLEIYRTEHNEKL